MTRSTRIDLNREEYNHGLRYYPFMVSLDRCDGSCNTFDDQGRICVLNKTENANINVFNKSKTLTKHISCDCKCNLMVENIIQM